jgi:acyl transferase domain-containing protein/acyl carrier protein
MDPQQRLLLEGAWEAFEDAGVDPASLRGSQTGVFTGVMYGDYGINAGSVSAELEGYLATGSTGSVVSGRLAYMFGLEGPAMTVDTACSSSLVTMHLASQALRSGECDLALAGGVTVLSTPGVFIIFSRQRGLAVDGRCKAFGAEADGVGWSEGLGLLLMERLSDARENGHRVLGLVRGTAVNQDGASNGLTAPNGPSQERVIRQALASAGLSARDVDAVEAHGTGTTLGDPIEAQALLATYGQERANGPLWLGSLKSNIGHAQAAAGVGGVIKMVQAMRHGVLPKTLHADVPSPHVDWSEGEVRLLSEQTPWESNGSPRRAGVSSFGISGTNAHVILEEAPAIEHTPPGAEAAPHTGPSQVSANGPSSAGPGALPFLVSAASAEALRGQAASIGAHLRGRPDLELGGVASALALDRARLSHRAVVVAEERGELLGGLAALERGGAVDGLVTGVAGGGGGVAFLFSGQGSQWAGMGRELWDSSPVFAERMQACADAFAPYLDFSLEDVLRDAEGAASLERVDVIQPALFAVMVSMAALWRSFGVKPAVVVGHSQGEIAAAYVAGALSLDDAARVVAARAGAIAAELSGRGGMVSVSLPAEQVEEDLRRWDGRVSLAVVNGPSSVVVSGESEALQELLLSYDAQDVRARAIPVDYASHSVQVEAIRERLLGELSSIAPRSGEVPFYSTTTGALLDTSELDGAYWYANLRQTVRFYEATQALVEDATTTFVEMSPHPVLTMAVEETAEARASDGADVAAIGSLRRGQGGFERFLLSLSEAYVHGVEVDWGALLERGPAERVELPTYAFQRKHYWLHSQGGATDASSLGQSSAEHPLLGSALALAGEKEGWLFTGRVSLRSHPWLRDHAVMGQVLMPGTGFVELALAAGERVGAAVLEELTLERPLLFDDEHGVQIQLSVSEPDETGKRSLGVYARVQDAAGDEPELEEEWVRHAAGVLVEVGSSPSFGGQGGLAGPELESFSGAEWPPAGAEKLDSEFLYDRLAEAGYNYGPVFQGLRSAWRVGEELYGEVALATEPSQAAGFGVHPALLDSALHAMFLGALDAGQSGEIEVPFAFSGVRLFARGASSLRVRLARGGDEDGGAGALSLLALDESGAPVLSVQELQTRAIDQSQLKGARPANHDALFELRWTELADASANGSSLHAVALGDGERVGAGGIELERYPDLDALEQAIADGAPAPAVVLVDAESAGAGPELERESGEGTSAEAVGGLGAGVHARTTRVLELLQAWIASKPLSEAKLLLLTEGAISVAGESPNLAEAALVGLVRTAQSEHPGRFGLLDLDRGEAAAGSLDRALRSEEPELAAREGSLYAPRLGRVPAAEEARASESFDPQATVLITGGTGGLGALLARHLVSEHGVRQLLLVSRSGAAAEGAENLRGELRELGCEVRIEACDVSQREQLEQLLATIPQEHPLGAAVHAAGVLDDGVIESLDGERIARVMAPKVDAAVNLHELIGPAKLIVFSSAAATMGNPGQGNYAAANAFVDALASYRRAQGLPATSMAWGAWEQATGMTEALGEADRARFERFGTYPLPDAQGLELFDVALDLDEPLLVPMRLDSGALRVQAKAGMLPAILQGLVRMPARRSADGQDSLTGRLAESPEPEWDGIVLELVRGQIAEVLGHSSPEAIDPQRAFKELGFDSLAAVELRNRLSQSTGLKLPSTLIFDHPSAAAVAKLIRSKVTLDGTARPAIDEGLDRLEALLPSIAADNEEQTRVRVRLQALTRRVEAFLADGAYGDAPDDAAAVEDALESATDDEVFELLDKRREG